MRKVGLVLKAKMMKLTQIYNNKDAQIWVNNPYCYLQINWLQHPTSTSFRQTLIFALNYALAYQVSCWMCDMREIIYLELTDQNWLVREVFPAFDPMSHHVYAFLVGTKGEELCCSYHINELVEERKDLNEKINIEIFFEKNLAQQWLLDQGKVRHCA